MIRQRGLSAVFGAIAAVLGGAGCRIDHNPADDGSATPGPDALDVQGGSHAELGQLDAQGNRDDTDGGDVEISRWSAWNAFLPLAHGSSGSGGPGTTPDVSSHGYSATYAHGISFVGAAMIMTGGGDVSIPPQLSVPAVDLTASYSVAAWVTMSDAGGWRTFVSADGTEVSEFYLQKRGDTNRFGFTLSTSDSNAGVNTPCIASSAFVPEANTRYHLVATRDATTGIDTLYVDGVASGKATCPASTGVGWAGDTFGIGHGMYNGSNTDYVAGSLSRVGLIGRVLTPDEVAAVYALGPGSGEPPPGGAGPCDIYDSGGTPCVAAHSTVRALFAAYDGSLYRVRRTSDGATKDVGVLGAGGFADSAAQDTFCHDTTCTISIIYDQSASGNHLTNAPGGGIAVTPDSEAIATAFRTLVGGHPVYAVYVSPGIGYRNNRTSGIAVADQPEGEYMVTSGTHYNGGCCFDYGNAETNNLNNGNGHMEAIYLGDSPYWGSGAGAGPWVMVDMENGLFSGGNAGLNAGDTSVPFDYVTAIVKGGPGHFVIKAGNAQSSTLSTMWDGARPNGYSSMSKEGAIVLGIGGDNSNGAAGTFFEGAMTFGYPSDATEAAVQANIAAAGYGH